MARGALTMRVSGNAMPSQDVGIAARLPLSRDKGSLEQFLKD